MTKEELKELKRPLIAVISVLVLILAGVWLANAAIEKEQQKSEDIVVIDSGNANSEPPADPNEPEPTKPTPPVVLDIPKRTSLEGTFTCLPHRDTSGPVTMECAYGIKTNHGYYATDIQDLGNKDRMLFESGSKVQIFGTHVDIRQISSNMWQKYNIEGIVKVESVISAK